MAPRDEHARRTLRTVRDALEKVPFYAKQRREAPAEDAPLEEALAALPLLTRDAFRSTLPKAWVPEGRDAKAELASGALAVVETGFGDSRMRFLFDRAWWRAQEARALSQHPRAARAVAGELGSPRDATLWVPERGTGSCGAGDPSYEERLDGARLHLNSRQDPTFWTEPVMTRMLDELARHETTALFADPFYLDVLARYAASAGRALDVRGFVALTRARATAAHRHAIRRAYEGPLLDVYGARACGVLFVEGEDGRLHHASATTHVELLRANVPTPGARDVALVVVTTLDRAVMPLVRYVVGDLVQIADGAPTDAPVPPLASVEGRLADAVVRPDGAIVTPGALDRALAEGSLAAYQVIQESPDAVCVEVVNGSPEAAREALAPLCQGMRVSARSTTAIAALPNGKFRSSRRDVPLAALESFGTPRTRGGAS